MESTPAGSGHKVVIIGVGGIARVYAQALAQIPDATLVAGAPPHPHPEGAERVGAVRVGAGGLSRVAHRGLSRGSTGG